MKNILEWTIEDIQGLIYRQETESIELEYKSSFNDKDWKSKNGDNIAEVVSAFANSVGGIVIIGVKEDKDHHAISIDGGIKKDLISKEALESVLDNRIYPRIEGILIKSIDNPDDSHHYYFAIQVPSSYRAPHMHNPRKVYFKRYNYQNLPMEHYEIEDIRNRYKGPILSSVVHLQIHEVIEDFLLRSTVHIVVTNTGNVIARDVLIRFYIPLSLIGVNRMEPICQIQYEWDNYNDVTCIRFEKRLLSGGYPLPLYPNDEHGYNIDSSQEFTYFDLHLPALVDQHWLFLKQHSPELLNYREIQGTPALDHPDIKNSFVAVELFADGMNKRVDIYQLLDLLK